MTVNRLKGRPVWHSKAILLVEEHPVSKFDRALVVQLITALGHNVEEVVSIKFTAGSDCEVVRVATKEDLAIWTERND